MDPDGRVLSEFDSELSDPVAYLGPSAALSSGCLRGVRNAFHCCKAVALGGRVPTGPLDDLYLEGFDDHGVWEEVELLNHASLHFLSRAVRQAASWRHVQLLGGAREDEEDWLVDEGEEEGGGEGVEDGEDEGGDEEGEEEEDEGEDEEGDTVKKPAMEQGGAVTSSVDDQFFKLSEMEQFLDLTERKEEGSGTVGEFDLFREWSSDEEENAHFGDFFDPASGEPGGQGDTTRQHMSTHERRQLKLQEQIAQLEAENVAEKSWQMGGEVGAKKRPVNSLLEEALEYEHMTRPPPHVTEETTQSLEDIIRQRIVDEAWDDVERKTKPKEKPYDYSRRRPLDQEKSQLSLAQVYEQEYLQQTQEAQGEKGDERHAEIERRMKQLFVKLDALSNFHFTPKPPKPEVKIVSSVPAITMEEVAPVTSSDVALLAPEELQARPLRPGKGAGEKSTTDRMRERRLKKKQKRLRVADKKLRGKLVSKIRPGLGNKYCKNKLKKQLGDRTEVDASLHSSSKFFARLQAEVQEEVQARHRLPQERTSSRHNYKL